MKPLFSFMWSVLFFAGAFLSVVGCGEDAETPDATVGCRLNSDCPPGSLCQSGECVEDELSCVGDGCPCASIADCALGEGCNVETGQCFALECLADSDCALGQACLDGRCETDLTQDRDRDGQPDLEDNCADQANADQANNDRDTQGDLCDLDDDNDAIPDALDNCELDANPAQGDADGDGVGNACDENAPGIDVRGTIDFSALSGASTALARVFAGGREEPEGIDEEGHFVFETLLTEPGRFLLRVEWPAFAPLVREFRVEDGVATFDVGELVMVPAAEGEDAVSLNGRVTLEGASDHSDVLIEARVGGELVISALTAEAGVFAMRVGPVDHRLNFRRVGYEDLEVTAIFNTQGGFAGRFTVDGVPLDEAELVLVAEPVASLSGEVSSSLGPREDWSSVAFVTLISQDQSIRRISPVIDGLEGRGQFQLGGLTPGQYTLGISAQGHLPHSAEVTLEEGENGLDGVIELVFEGGSEEAGVPMRGRVTLEGADDHGDITIRAHVAGNLAATTVTDDEGQFVFEAGRADHLLSFSRPGFVAQRNVLVRWDSAENRFEVDDAPLDGFDGFRLSRLTGQIEVTVQVEPDWVPQGQRAVVVTILGADREDSAVADGAPVVFTDLPNGNYIVFVERPGFTQGRRSVALDQQNPSGSVSLSVELLDLAEANLDLSGTTLTGAELRETPRLQDANLAGITLVGGNPEDGAELCNLDLSGASLVGADLSGANLAGTILVGARLDNASLVAADLGAANLTGASLFGANLAGVDLRNGPYTCQGQSSAGQKTLLTGANLSSANLSDAQFTDGLPSVNRACVLAEALSPEVSFVRWNQADLSGATMTNTALGLANINAAIMTQTDLRGACLENATILQTDMTDARLQNASLRGASVLNTIWLRTVVDGAELEGASLSGVNLTDASLVGISGDGLALADTILNGASFLGASLIDSEWVGILLSDVALSGATLTGADMRNAQFIDVSLDGVSFAGVDLRNTTMVQLDATDVDFTGALLNGADLSGANLQGANLTGATLLGTGFRLSRYDRATQWPEGFEFRTIQALGFETQLGGFVFPNGFSAAGLDLSGADLTNTRMVDMDLSGADLTGVSIQGSFVRGIDLSGANLTRFRGHELQGLDPRNCEQRLPAQWLCGESRSGYVLLGPGTLLHDADLRDLEVYGDFGVEEEEEGDLPTFNLRGASFEGADLTLARLNGADLSQVDLGRAILASAELADVDLSEALIAETSLSGADLSRASFIDANIHDTNMRDAFLNQADFTGANLSNVVMTGASLGGANFDVEEINQLTAHTLEGSCPFNLPEGWSCRSHNANQHKFLIGPGGVLENVDLSGAGLGGALMSDLESVAGLKAASIPVCPSTLPDGWFCREQPATSRFVLAGPDVDLSGVDLTDVDLDGVNLTAANMANAVLTNLRAVNLQGCPDHLPSPWRCIRQANGAEALLGPSADLSGIVFGDVQAEGVDLTEADLSRTSWIRANLARATLTGADLNNADVRIANLTSANLSETNLTSANFNSANLSRADLLSATTTRTNFISATFSDTTRCSDGRFESSFSRCGF